MTNMEQVTQVAKGVSDYKRLSWVARFLDMPMYGASNGGMVIDVSINVDGQVGQYVVPETSEVVTAGNLLLTPNSSQLLNDIQSTKQQRELVLSSVDQYKSDIEKCNTLLAEYDPVYKNKQETENRLQKIEKAIESIPSIEATLSKMSQVLEKLS